MPNDTPQNPFSNLRNVSNNPLARFLNLSSLPGIRAIQLAELEQRMRGSRRQPSTLEGRSHPQLNHIPERFMQPSSLEERNHPQLNHLTENTESEQRMRGSRGQSSTLEGRSHPQFEERPEDRALRQEMREFHSRLAQIRANRPNLRLNLNSQESEHVTLSERVSYWLPLSDDMRAHWDQIAQEENADTFRDFLKAFREQTTVSDKDSNQPHFKEKFKTFLEKKSENTDFAKELRAKIFVLAENAMGTCVDRKCLEYINMEQVVREADVSHGKLDNDMDAIIKFGREAFFRDKIQKIARKKVEQLEHQHEEKKNQLRAEADRIRVILQNIQSENPITQNDIRERQSRLINFRNRMHQIGIELDQEFRVDEIQVYLSFQDNLSEPLKLTKQRNMAYGLGVANLTEQDIKVSAEQMLQSKKEEFRAFLLNWEPLKSVFRRKDPENFDNVWKTVSQEIEKAIKNTIPLKIQEEMELQRGIQGMKTLKLL